MAKGTKLARLGIKRLPGTMYYIKEQAVWSVPRGGGRKVRVARFDQPVPPGTLCYVDRDGDVCCAPRRSGGGRKATAVKRAAGVRRLLTPAGAQAALKAARSYIATNRPATRLKKVAARAQRAVHGGLEAGAREAELARLAADLKKLTR